MITDEVIAVVELVRNSYDADATKVTVDLINVTKKKGMIVISDDGHGMTLEILHSAWMEPARENKVTDDGQRPRTKRFKRMPMGEKGVGRFSVDKLGLRLEVITRHCDFRQDGEVINLSDTEAVLLVEGRQFEAGKYLDEVECKWILRPPEVFEGMSHGTVLSISDLRSEWTRDLVEKTQLGLSRLSSPIDESKDFEVVFKTNDFPELSQRVRNPLLAIAPWYLDADVGRNGVMKYSYRGIDGEEQGIVDLRKSSGRFKSVSGDDELREPLCGPFRMRLFAFEKEKGLAKRFGLDKEKLELLAALCGVSVYRDGFRVWPYGETGNDWLLFDKRRVQNPGGVLGNDRVIGYVAISRAQNPFLRDKTNREGLIEEGLAFGDLRELATTISNFLGAKRQMAMPGKPRSMAKATKAKTDIQDNADKINSRALQIGVKIEEAKSAAGKGDTEGATKAIGDAQMEIKEIADAIVEIKTGTEQLMGEFTLSDEQIQNLIALSGIGMSAERMTHEVIGAAMKAKELLKESEKMVMSGKADIMIVKKNLEGAGTQLEVVIEAMKQMEPLYYSRRKSVEPLDVGEVAVQMGRFFNNTLKDQKISLKVEGGESKLKVDMGRGNLMQVFNNLFDNSIYWLTMETANKNKKIEIRVIGKERKVIFADNGPGVAKYIEDHIFEPFVTAKNDGRGLGLYIVRDILQTNEASIDLILEKERKILEGANFEITFAKGDK